MLQPPVGSSAATTNLLSLRLETARLHGNRLALLRETLNSAIDSCEALEIAGYAEEHRGRTVVVDGQPVTVQEFLISAWTLPESVRYAVIRQRHDVGADSPYVPEAARILVAAAAACAEIIGAGKNPPGADGLRAMVDWYRNHFDPNVKRAIDG